MAYNLELCHITPEEEAEEGVIESEWVKGDAFGAGHGSRRVDWLEHLASAVARNCFCRSLIVTGSNAQVFVGLPLNRASAIQTFKYLASAAQQIAKADLETFKMTEAYVSSWEKRVEARLWKRSFLVSFASAISSRVNNTRLNLTSGTEGSSGLVLVRRIEQSLDEWSDSHIKRKPAPAIGGHVGNGFKNGYSRGNHISLKASAGISAGGAQ